MVLQLNQVRARNLSNSSPCGVRKVAAMAGKQLWLLGIFLVVVFHSAVLPSATHAGDCRGHAAEASGMSDTVSLHPLKGEKVQLAAAEALVKRLLPDLAAFFQLELLSEEECGGGACFDISDTQPGLIALKTHSQVLTNTTSQVRIRGTSGVDIAAGLHYYLKNKCGAHVSWEKTGGSQLESIKQHTLNGDMPKVGQSTRVARPVKWSYYQNVCTVSYSMVWWDWARWEKEIGEDVFVKH